MNITVSVPTIPTRTRLLARALDSVLVQQLPPAALRVESDVHRQGAAVTRDRTWQGASTDWVAFLDDDDEFLPWHLRVLAECAEATQADLVYPWFDVQGGTDPFPQFEGRSWDNADPHQIPITFLVRTELLQECGGFAFPDFDPDDPGMDPLGHRAGEDYRFVLRAVDLGASIVHLQNRSWRWHHHGRNTSGLPSRW